MIYKNVLVGMMLILASATAQAAGKYGDLDQAGSNVFDRASVQRGAALFVNYCMGCHSAQFVRYQRLSEDLGLSEAEVQQFLIFGNQDMSDYMVAAMRESDGAEWFGAPAPDLSLTARSKGPDWIYTFMRSFYLTDEGWNNRVLEYPSMPHVLWELQGIQRAVTESRTTADGQVRVELVGLELDQPGLLSPAEYDNAVRDLVAFMEYIAEPAILKRKGIGLWVLVFLSLFTFLTYLLYQEFWKDVKK
jgi:ubiquinol-cytochrome c reductase cytochrome c1 subunit